MGGGLRDIGKLGQVRPQDAVTAAQVIQRCVKRRAEILQRTAGQGGTVRFDGLGLGQQLGRKAGHDVRINLKWLHAHL